MKIYSPNVKNSVLGQKVIYWIKCVDGRVWFNELCMVINAIIALSNLFEKTEKFESNSPSLSKASQKSAGKDILKNRKE
jgi:hypothetical protein